MLVTEKCIFLHMPKTGGHFCRDVIRKTCGEVLHTGGWHAPYSRVPKQFGHLPVLFVVRNPWDWYVSWYHYMIDMLENGHPNPLIVNASMNAEIGFESIMSYVFRSVRQGSVESRKLEEYFKSDRHIKSKAERPGIRDLDRQMLEKMRRKRYGIMSWRFDTLLAGCSKKNIRFIEFSDLNAGLIRAIKEMGVEIENSLELELLGRSRVNVGVTRKDTHYREFYKSNGLREAIAHYEKGIVNMFSFEF